MGKEKLTKRDLKSDELRSFFDHGWEWIKVQAVAHPDWTRIIIFTLVVILVGIPVYGKFSSYQETKAARLMSEGKMYIRTAQQATTVADRNANLQAAVTKFTLVIEDYARTSAYPEALKTIALASSGMGQDEAALGYYDRFINGLDDHPDLANVKFAKAGILQEIKRYDEAVKLYEELLQDERAAYLVPHLCFQLASVYDLGLNQPEQAIEYYRKVPRPVAGGVELWYNQARMRLAALGAPLPPDTDADTTTPA